MKKIYSIMLLLLFYLLISCNRSAPGYDINKVIKAPNGWINDNTYQLSLFGQWDRDTYYPVEKESVPDKIVKSGFDLRKQAEAAIFSQIKVTFDDKLRGFIRDQVQEFASAIVIDEAINNNLGKTTLTLFIVEKAYTKEHDAYILVQINYPNLKLLVANAIEEVKNIIRQEEEASLVSEDSTSITNTTSTTNQ